MNMLDFAPLAILFPLIGAIVLGFFGAKMPRKTISYLAPGMIGLSFIVSLFTLYAFGLEKSGSGAVNHVVHLFTWIKAGDFYVDWAFLIDPLSITMMLVVTGVSFLIHVYSVGYMAHDKDYARFFCYLNLFVGAMLILVLGSSLPVMFIGWEGVGLCSYLLIGFWYEKKSANLAGMKAFVVNRIGDFGVLVAMFLLVTYGNLNSLGFLEINEMAGRLSHTASNSPFLVAVCLFLFLGAAGKSAQIPLYVWLPDAMEGPTPVSALIHAATMVTSGVYMLARLNVLFASTPSAMLVVAVIGCATAFFAATIALSQVDIKRVLAYSTVSQLGYMFLACGVGAFWVGIFHLMTHAFFKALLFLGAGSVIHGMHEDQDIRNMGGLAKKMPATYWTFLIATLAIAGVPFLSGFFSKDEILAFTYWFGIENQTGKSLYFVALLTAGMTAFYMFRLLIRTFLGKPQSDKASHAHESPKVMTVPLIILAVLSVIGGYVALPHVISEPLHYPNPLEKFLAPVAQTYEELPEEWTPSVVPARIELIESGEFPGGEHGIALESEVFPQASLAHDDGHDDKHHPADISWLLILASILIAALGIYAAFLYYRDLNWDKMPGMRRAFDRAKGLQFLSLNKWFIDELYQYLIVEPGKILANICWIFDRVVVDGIINGTAGLFGFMGSSMRRLQTGVVRIYALSIFLGAVSLVLLIILSRMVL